MLAECNYDVNEATARLIDSEWIDRRASRGGLAPVISPSPSPFDLLADRPARPAPSSAHPLCSSPPRPPSDPFKTVKSKTEKRREAEERGRKERQAEARRLASSSAGTSGRGGGRGGHGAFSGRGEPPAPTGRRKLS